MEYCLKIKSLLIASKPQDKNEMTKYADFSVLKGNTPTHKSCEY